MNFYRKWIIKTELKVASSILNGMKNSSYIDDEFKYGITIQYRDLKFYLISNRDKVLCEVESYNAIVNRNNKHINSFLDIKKRSKK